jgi:Fusaric acid resistance protein-like
MGVLRVEAGGVRTAAAAVLPLIVGQLLGQPALGLLVGLGGLYLSVTDKEGSTLRSLVVAVFVNGAALLAGMLAAGNAPLSICLMFAWALLAGMASAYGEVASQIGFISTIAFATSLGTPAGLHAGSGRAAAFVVGGLWGAALTLLLWHFHKRTSEASETPEANRQLVDEEVRRGLVGQFKANLTFRSIIFRHALRLAVAATIAVALYKTLRLERGYWLIITVLVIVKPVFADTRRRTLERVLGSVVGGALAALLAASVHNVVALNLLLIVFSVLAYSHVRHNYSLFVVFLTPFVVLMIETVQPTDWRIALTRIIDTALGGVIALAVSYLLRPRAAFR